MKVVSNTKESIVNAEPVTVARESRGAIIVNLPAGTPLGDAFNQLSVLMSSAMNAVEATANHEDGDSTGTWSAVHNLQIAYDLVQSMHEGYIEHRKREQPGQ